MNLAEIYNDDKHPAWCWDEDSLIRMVMQMSLAKIKEARLLFLRIVEITDNYLWKIQQIDTKKNERNITNKDIEYVFGSEIIEMYDREKERGYTRNRRAKEMANILAIDISLRRIWHECQTDSSREDDEGTD